MLANRLKNNPWNERFFLLGSVSLLAVILAAGMFFQPADLPGRTLCLFRNLLHLDCPGCGLTRAFLLIPHGQVLEATSLNWGALPLYLLFVMMLSRLVFRFRLQEFFASKTWMASARALSLVTAVLLLSHWAVKTVLFFSRHSFWEYAQLIQINAFVLPH